MTTKIKIGSYILTVSLSKEDSIEVLVPSALWYDSSSSDDSILNYDTTNWKQFIGNDKIASIRALRYYYHIKERRYPDLKTAKEYVERYAVLIGKPF